MKKLMVSCVLIFVFGCTFSLKKVNEPLEKNELNFVYESTKEITFSVPRGGINMPTQVMAVSLN